MGVAEAVEGDVEGTDESDEALAHVVGVLGRADDGGEDVPGLLPALPHQLGGLELRIPVVSQDLDGAVVDVDDSAAAA